MNQSSTLWSHLVDEYEAHGVVVKGKRKYTMPSTDLVFLPTDTRNGLYFLTPKVVEVEPGSTNDYQKIQVVVFKTSRMFNMDSYGKDNNNSWLTLGQVGWDAKDYSSHTVHLMPSVVDDSEFKGRFDRQEHDGDKLHTGRIKLLK